MKIFGYILAAAVMLICGSIYGSWKTAWGKKALAYKALATLMTVIIAVIGAVTVQNRYMWLIVAGLILCMAADVCLEIWFVAGVIVFGAAHLCFIAAILPQITVHWYTWLLILALYGCFFVSFRTYLPHLGKLLVPAVIYPLLLCAMAAFFVTGAIENPGVTAYTSMAGGICFVISDYILAKRTLEAKQERWYGAAVLILYYMAVYLIAFWG